jgi:WD repeat and SOF domain-containing protein 1
MPSSSRYITASALRRGRYTDHIDSSVVPDKMDTRAAHNRSWLIPLPASASVPGAKTRRVRVRVVSPAHVQSISWLGRRGLFSRCCAFLGGLFAVCAVLILLGTEETNWAPTFRDSTLVFSRNELQRIWRWEIDNGNHPSSAKSEMVSIVCRAHIYRLAAVPEQIGFTTPILNPALPPAKAHTLVSSFTPPHGPVITTTRGIGPQRTYLQKVSRDLDTVAYPPRPISGSIADLNIILDHCNFVDGKVNPFLFPFRVEI